MTWIRRLFVASGVLGLLALVPLYFRETRLGLDFPPPITHPELFYGFLGVTIAWQMGYIVIGSDPRRYRPFMLLGAFGKLSFSTALTILLLQGRVPAVIFAAGLPDVVMAILFVAAYFHTA
jgi:hypothetical protein